MNNDRSKGNFSSFARNFGGSTPPFDHGIDGMQMYL